MRRHRELFALAHRSQPRRPAADLLRIPARARPAVHRREPRHHPPDRRHVPGRLPAEVHPGGVRLPPAVLHGQPPAQVRGVGGHAPPDGPRLRHAGQVGDGEDRRRVRRTGDPPHRPDRPAGGGPPRLQGRLLPGRRRHRRGEGRGAARLPQPRHHLDQEDGRGPQRVHARAGRARALHALRRRYGGAHRDHPRPAAGRLRRADRHQPAARGPGHPRMRPGRHPGRRQGGGSCAPRRPWSRPSAARRETSTAA